MFTRKDLLISLTGVFEIRNFTGLLDNKTRIGVATRAEHLVCKKRLNEFNCIMGLIFKTHILE